MKTEKLDYYLPPELIAQQPANVRGESRLLVLGREDGSIQDAKFEQISSFLHPGDCLVINDTKVIAARFFARRQTGGKLEGLFLAEEAPGLWQVMLKGGRKIKAGEQIYLTDHAENDFCTAEAVGRNEDGGWILKIAGDFDAKTVLENIGLAPLPPYIKRGRDISQAAIDRQRYQTVYARNAGAVAAPTAGLHFTAELMERLKAKGISIGHVTLHVGAGTFKPIKTETLAEHQIHSEKYQLDEKNAQIINIAVKNGGRIIAVGTTAVRTMETIAKGRTVEAQNGTTRLFITPGYRFKLVDAMITNFHLPRSTLLGLVASFAGLESVLNAYHHAIEKRYRFYSYGDAMMIV